MVAAPGPSASSSSSRQERAESGPRARQRDELAVRVDRIASSARPLERKRDRLRRVAEERLHLRGRRDLRVGEDVLHQLAGTREGCDRADWCAPSRCGSRPRSGCRASVSAAASASSSRSRAVRAEQHTGAHPAPVGGGPAARRRAGWAASRARSGRPAAASARPGTRARARARPTRASRSRARGSAAP